MVGNKNKFHEVEAYDGGKGNFRKNLLCTIVGKGTVALNESTNYKDLYLVEGLKYNLLSVAQLVDKCYRFEFNKGSCRIFDKTNKLLATIEQSKGNLFYLNISENSILVAKNDNSWLWLRRLCHVNFESIVS